MELTLLLNSTYEPLRVLHWQKAITLLWQGKVEVLEVYDREIHGISISIKLPAVMRLLKMVKLKDSHRAVKFSRINIFTRDGYACQYCNHKFKTEDLTFDHVVPIAKGGRRLGKILSRRAGAAITARAGARPMKRTCGWQENRSNRGGTPLSPLPSGFEMLRRVGGIICTGIWNSMPMRPTPDFNELY